MTDPVSPSFLILSLVFGCVLLLWMRNLSSGWKSPSKSGARVPAGSMGWPIVGEMPALARNPTQFVCSRVQRYGSIFRSHLFFEPIILGTTSEFAKFVLGNSALFGSGWPASLRQLLGSKAFMFQDGLPHLSVKNLVQKALLPEALKTQVASLEDIILDNLNCWAAEGSVSARERTKIIMVDVGMYVLLGVRNIGSTPEGVEGRANFDHLSRGIVSAPINLPGTAYRKGLKAKAALTKYFKYLLEQKKGTENHKSDILGVLLEAIQNPQSQEEVKDLDDDTVADNLVLMWFGSFHSTATTLTWILKLLLDNPDVYEKVQAEQLEIRMRKDPSQRGLTWEDTRKMVFTSKFFMEVQRFVAIGSILFRTATQDVEYKGHMIPKGSKVLVMVDSIHKTPTNWSDPTKFDPSRHDATPKQFTYLPFGGGPRLCPGREFAKLVSLIFVHHLTTTFVHESTAPDQGIDYSNGLPSPKGGYPITFSRNTST